jgi:hypothetical protein
MTDLDAVEWRSGKGIAGFLEVKDGTHVPDANRYDFQKKVLLELAELTGKATYFVLYYKGIKSMMFEVREIHALDKPFWQNEQEFRRFLEGL